MKSAKNISPMKSATKLASSARRAVKIVEAKEEESVADPAETTVGVPSEQGVTHSRSKKKVSRAKVNPDVAGEVDEPATSTKETAPVTPSRRVSESRRAAISPLKKPTPREDIKPGRTTTTTTTAIAVDTNIAKVLKTAYSIIAKQRGLAYGTPHSPIYGENTETSMRRALAAMGVGDSPGNVYCDVGSGSGAPCIHAACEYPSLTCYGFELMGSRWWISQSIVLRLLNNPVTRSSAQRVLLAHLDLTALRDFGPCTHVFSFDVGFPQSAIEAFAHAVNNSKYIRVLGSFQKLNVLENAGFQGLRLLEQVSMKQVGSGEGRTLNVYSVTHETESTPKERKSLSWNVTGLYPPPTDTILAPSVPHSSTYPKGEEARLQCVESYIEWVKDQVGLDRSDRVQTRSRARSAGQSNH